MKDIDRTTFEGIWDALAPRDFAEAELQPVPVNGYVFRKLHLARGDAPTPARIRLDGALYGMPRFAAYRYRVVLFAHDVLLHGDRWEVRTDDIRAWLAWARRVQYMVTFSTHKSGASMPHSLHAQSFPTRNRAGEELTALSRVKSRVVVERGRMPRFTSLEVSVLQDYPLRGLRLTGEDDDVARKIFELALGHDHLKAFNIVMVPAADGDVDTFFFPRRKDGRATFDMGGKGSRWQIAALEANGLLQAKTPEDLGRIDARKVLDIFDHIGLPEQDYSDFLVLLETF